MSLESHGAETANSDTKNTLSYAPDESKLKVEEKQESYSTVEKNGTEKIVLGEAVQEGVDQQKRTAKIHDFCFGIPFGKCSQLDRICTSMLHEFTVNSLIYFTLVFVCKNLT